MFIFALPFLLGLGCIAIMYPRTTTTTIPGAETVSPNGAWKAFVEETIHEFGLAGLAEDLEIVYVQSLDRPGQAVRILTVFADGRAGAVPRLAWTAPGILQITIASQVPAKIDRQEYKGLRIDLRYAPDDPTARRARLKNGDPPPDAQPVPGR